jgi:hypothetical protein
VVPVPGGGVLLPVLLGGGALLPEPVLVPEPDPADVEGLDCEGGRLATAPGGGGLRGGRGGEGGGEGGGGGVKSEVTEDLMPAILWMARALVAMVAPSSSRHVRKQGRTRVRERANAYTCHCCHAPVCYSNKPGQVPTSPTIAAWCTVVLPVTAGGQS